jgi:HdeA/HdeB family
MMKYPLMILAFAIWILPVTANAQLTVEMANIRCEQYLAMPLSQSRNFSAWMSGWFSYQIGKTWVDLVAYEKNIANVKAWCKYHPRETDLTWLF